MMRPQIPLLLPMLRLISQQPFIIPHRKQYRVLTLTIRVISGRSILKLYLIPVVVRIHSLLHVGLVELVLKDFLLFEGEVCDAFLEEGGDF